MAKRTRKVKPSAKRTVRATSLSIVIETDGRNITRREVHAGDEASMSVAEAIATGIEMALCTRRCRICGCTDEQGCPEGCSWVEDDLCSSCDKPACEGCGKLATGRSVDGVPLCDGCRRRLCSRKPTRRKR